MPAIARAARQMYAATLDAARNYAAFVELLREGGPGASRGE